MEYVCFSPHTAITSTGFLFKYYFSFTSYTHIIFRPFFTVLQDHIAIENVFHMEHSSYHMTGCPLVWLFERIKVVCLPWHEEITKHQIIYADGNVITQSSLYCIVRPHCWSRIVILAKLSAGVRTNQRKWRPFWSEIRWPWWPWSWCNTSHLTVMKAVVKPQWPARGTGSLSRPAMPSKYEFWLKRARWC